MHKELTGDRYLTLALALLDVGTGAVSFVQAGHPHPILLRRSGATEVLGQGGLPIGLLQEASFDICKMWMRPGDRLILYTDGLTECTDPDGTMLDEPGLLAICDRHRHRAGPEFLQRLKQDLVGFSRAEEFSDDASAIVLDYKGPPA
ncbi:Serine phosphatase RsbU, regulator of sigma subunit [Roseibacterium elongatum DSM 19469]|uniref:Serine phosphatase RsbU, regulator of sigma subunit n=1 Tax=Roseicyclus elongatus DSM 19469 TaxID=1294273 RepID=W8RR48_9RHOB|nr:PP2C family protein-serine/threonine phosphatase [Roseibacterium elongatum]AHM03553.1 Serine phosphatase RsbU, regulator of sigma subunit [Roseibacterium elongatum DSM 19469]